MGWLAKANPGNARPEPRDGIMQIDPVLVNCGRFPYPITRTSIVGSLPATEKIQGSLVMSRQDVVGVALGFDWLAFSEGVWDVEVYHRMILRGAVNDSTADAAVLLQVVDSGVTRFGVISRISPVLTVNQDCTRRFTVTVTKEIPTNIRLQHAIGLGTSTVESLVSVIASRIY
jgi:hypothetical protein